MGAVANFSIVGLGHDCNSSQVIIANDPTIGYDGYDGVIAILDLMAMTPPSLGWGHSHGVYDPIPDP